MNATSILCVLAALAAPLLGAQEPHVHEHDAAEQAAPATTAQPRESGALPRTPVPVLTAADRAAAQAPGEGEPAHDNGIHSYLLADELEMRDVGRWDGLAWKGEGWIGTDLNRLWLRTTGERESGVTTAADVEVLYGRSILPWWDLVAGVRHDARPTTRNFVALGIQGVAPQFIEMQATAYIGDGQTAARLEIGSQLLFTHRLILQPGLELELFGSDEPERGVGAGLATIEAGLRLRYEVTRRFAPYLGVAWERAVGETADLRRAASEDAGEVRLVAGVRMWF